jgi:hypothetical protein
MVLCGDTLIPYVVRRADDFEQTIRRIAHSINKSAHYRQNVANSHGIFAGRFQGLPTKAGNRKMNVTAITDAVVVLALCIGSSVHASTRWACLLLCRYAARANLLSEKKHGKHLIIVDLHRAIGTFSIRRKDAWKRADKIGYQMNRYVTCDMWLRFLCSWKYHRDLAI